MRTMKLDELNEPFLPGRWVWLKQPPGPCWVDKAFMAEECERCYSIWNYSRLANKREGEDIDPRARGKDDTNAPTYLIEQAPKSCCNRFELDTALNRGFFIFYLAEWKAFRKKKTQKTTSPWQRWPTGVRAAFPKGSGSKFCFSAKSKSFCLSCQIQNR